MVPFSSKKAAGVEGVVVDPGGLQTLGSAKQSNARRTVAQIESRCLGSTSADDSEILVPSRGSIVVARQDLDRLGGQLGRRDQSRSSLDAQAPEGRRVEIGTDDGGRHLLPVGTTTVHGRPHPGESGEPPGSEDGLLGILASLDRVPPQLLRLRDEVLRIEHEDPDPVLPGTRHVSM